MTSATTNDGDLVTYGQIVLFGDSITEQSFNPEFFTSGSALANTFARRLDVVNRGFSGYTTNQAIALLPRIFPCRNEDVKLAFVFFGANDAVLPGSVQHVPIETFVHNHRQMLTSEALRGKVIAITPPPIDEYTHDPKFGLTRTANVTQTYASAVRDLCSEIDVPCADVWSAFMTSVGWKPGDSQLPGSKDVPPNSTLASYFRDGLHPLGPGYRIIYQTMIDQIAESFPELMPGVQNPHTPYWLNAIVPQAGTLTRWALDTTIWNEDKYSELVTLVPLSDQQKFSKFHFQKDRFMALGSALLQRQFIAEILGRDIKATEPIDRDDHNRPLFSHKSVRNHDFNVSHHGGVVVLAGLLDSEPVGIDLTNLPPDPIAAYLADFEDCFSVEEWTQIGNDGARFAQHWALKEAVLKATGTGIVVDLKAIEFTEVKYVSARNRIESDAAKVKIELGERGEGQERWRFELQLVGDQYVAIASHCVSPVGAFQDITF